MIPSRLQFTLLKDVVVLDGYGDFRVKTPGGAGASLDEAAGDTVSFAGASETRSEQAADPTDRTTVRASAQVFFTVDILYQNRAV